jgi:hypothetical protein
VAIELATKKIILEGAPRSKPPIAPVSWELNKILANPSWLASTKLPHH